MGRVDRAVRRAVNPISTGLTAWWCGMPSVRRVPHPAPGERTGSHVYLGVPSPGDWVVPAGVRPGWDWLPEHGASPELRAVPAWVRIWYRTPLLDRYAHEWMWWHGGWSVLVPGDRPPPPAGVREPRRPPPAPVAGTAATASRPRDAH